MNQTVPIVALVLTVIGGAGAFIFQANTNCICLDTHDLQNTSDNVKIFWTHK